MADSPPPSELLASTTEVNEGQRPSTTDQEPTSPSATVQETTAKDENDDTCTTSKAEKGVTRYEDIPVSDRLTYPHGTKLDNLFAATEKPYGFVPKKFLPMWPEMPLDQTLPSLPAPKGFLPLSRGKAGEKLIRKEPDYTVYDPLNQARVIQSPYEPLHDPDAKSFFMSPLILKYMKERNFIDADGNVNCTRKEFNEFRRYLNNRIYRPSLNSTLESNVERIRAHNENQIKQMKIEISKTEGTQYKVEKHQQRAKQLKAIEMKRRKEFLDAATAYNDFRQEAHERMIEERKQMYQLRGIAKWNSVKQKREYVERMHQGRSCFVMRTILSKIRDTTRKQELDKQTKEFERDEFLKNWLAVRCEEQTKKLANEMKLKKSVNAALKQAAIKREMKIDRAVATLSQRVIDRKKEEERIFNLTKKYFYIWLNQVRSRKANKPDEQHQSFWSVSDEMDAALKHIRKESGCEKFDDFVMNILKLKRDIKAELESEEQAELAAALGIELTHHASASASAQPSEAPVIPEPESWPTPKKPSVSFVEAKPSDIPATAPPEDASPPPPPVDASSPPEDAPPPPPEEDASPPPPPEDSPTPTKRKNFEFQQ